MLRLPGRSPLPSVTLKCDLEVCRHTPASTPRPSRTIDRSAYPHVNGGTRDPPDLGAVPDAFRSLRPSRKAGFLSWGCPKIAPPSFKPRSPSPGSTRPRVATETRSSLGMGTPVPTRDPPSWFLTTSAVCSSTTLRPYFRPLPILGFTTFPSVAKRNSPRCAYCPSKPSLRRQLRATRTNPVFPWACVTFTIVSDRSVTANLASSPFSPHPCAHAPTPFRRWPPCTG